MSEPVTVETLLAESRILIFDTEFTAWPGSLERGWTRPDEHREIVQIGGVLLDRDCEEIGAFSHLVRPILNPVLSQYLVDLTGITNGELDAHAASLADVLEQFVTFCSTASMVCSFGTDDEVIQANCDLIGLKNPMALVPVLDIRSCLCEAGNVKTEDTDCGRLPLAFGLAQQPKSHNALSDARAVASVLRHLKSFTHVVGHAS